MSHKGYDCIPVHKILELVNSIKLDLIELFH